MIFFLGAFQLLEMFFLSSGGDVRRMQNDSHFVRVFTIIKLSDVTSPSIVKSTMRIIGSWTLYKTLHEKQREKGL